MTVLLQAEAMVNIWNTYISCHWPPLEATLSILNVRLLLLKPVILRKDRYSTRIRSVGQQFILSQTNPNELLPSIWWRTTVFFYFPQGAKIACYKMHRTELRFGTCWVTETIFWKGDTHLMMGQLCWLTSEWSKFILLQESGLLGCDDLSLG